MSLEVINKRLKILSDLQEEFNKAKAIYEDSLESDSQYQEIQEETNKVKEDVKEKKAKVMQNSAYKELADKLKEIREEMKENKEILAQELADYYKDSGTMEITDPEGNVKRIKFSARLVDA